MEGTLDPKVRESRDSFERNLDFCKPYWEQYARLYALWHGHKFPELNATISKIMVNLFHTFVQDKLPKIKENLFSNPRAYMTLRADSPQAQFGVKGAQAFMQDLISEKIKMPSSIDSTLQTTIIGGTGWRMPHTTYVQKGKKWEPRIGSKNLEFFHFLPSPDGGKINDFDNNGEQAIEDCHIVDWWTREKIEYYAKKGYLNKEGVRQLLKERKHGEIHPEDTYRNEFAIIGNLHYEGRGQWRSRAVRDEDGNEPRRKYRVVYHFMRNKTRIIGEDFALLYDGEPLFPNGYFPVAGYKAIPDADNLFGLPYLFLVEDLIKALIMNFNYRMDHLLGVMFPVTWIRDDVRRNKPKSDFHPKPYDVKFFPQQVQDISRAVFVDRRPDVSQDTFLNEDQMKAFLQKVAGQTETTSSLNDVVGNRTATGVTSILNELSGRPNMESAILEQGGLRDEYTLLLSLASKHITDKQFIYRPDSEDAFPWTAVDPDDITDDYTVIVNGTTMLADKNQTFQRLQAMWPFINQSPTVDQWEAMSQALDVADIFADKDAVMLPDAAGPNGVPAGGPAGAPERPGGVGSTQDIKQQYESTQNRETPQPGGGSQSASVDALA